MAFFAEHGCMFALERELCFGMVEFALGNIVPVCRSMAALAVLPQLVVMGILVAIETTRKIQSREV